MFVCSCVAVAVLGLSIAGTADALRTDPMGGTGGGPIDGELQVTVVYEDTANPISGAFVMLGDYEGSPFAGNWGLTDAAGQIAFTDGSLTGPVNVTAGADGHTFFTLVDVDASEVVLSLSPIAAREIEYQVGDYVSGIDVDNGFAHFGDGYLDLAFVLPALDIDDLMSFDMEALTGPMETIEIMGDEYEVPSNMFIPQQWEMLVEIKKDHYYLYLSPDEYVIGALSGRMSVDSLSGGEMDDLLNELDWRETDIIDVTITGDTNEADLNVDANLDETVTLNVSNLPEDSSSWCVSIGDLDGLNGLGNLLILGLGSLDCPAGSGDCGGSVSLTTTAATGEFADVGYHSFVSVSLNDTEDMLVIMGRDDHPQTYTEDISDFFELLDLAYADAEFSWNDVMSIPNGSPDVDVQFGSLSDVETEEDCWDYLAPGTTQGFTPPVLPVGAPIGLVAGATYAWDHVSSALAYDLTDFDFDDFDFEDVLAHCSHAAMDDTEIVYESADTGVDDWSVADAAVLRGNFPNPFNPSTRIAFDLPRAADVTLEVYSIGGRRVATLVDGAMTSGPHDVSWYGLDDEGHAMSSGVYFIRLEADGETASGKMVLLK